MKKIAILSTLTYTILTMSGSAITLAYQGVITSGGGPLGTTGDSFSVIMNFPSSLADTSPSLTYGSYRAFGAQVSSDTQYEINGNILFVPATNYFDIFVSNPTSGSDRFEVEAFTGTGPGGSAFFNLFLVDPTRTALTGDGLPTSLQLPDFATKGSNLFVGGSSYFGTVTSLTYVVPEPTASVFILLSVLLVISNRQRTSRDMTTPTSRPV